MPERTAGVRPEDIEILDEPNDVVPEIELLDEPGETAPGVAGGIEWLNENIEWLDEGRDDLCNLVLRGEQPLPGEYKTEFVIVPGDTGLVKANVYTYTEDAQNVVTDAVLGTPLKHGELVVEIGSAGPIGWDTFKMLVTQSGGRYAPDISITQADLDAQA